MINEVFFDVETKKIFEDLDNYDPAGLGVSICSVYCRQLDDQLQEINGVMTSFWEEDFPHLWSLFQSATRIIGFNTLKFDIPALQPYTTLPLKKYPHFDILDEIKKITGHRISLNSIARETLGQVKSDSGLMAVRYWAEQTPTSLAKLQHYCEDDVLLTKKVYDFGRQNNELRYQDHWNDAKTITVDFSYPPLENAQTTLF